MLQWHADIESVPPSPDIRAVSSVFAVKRSEFVALSATVRDCVEQDELAAFDECVRRITAIDILSTTPVEDRGKSTVLAVMNPLIELLNPRTTVKAEPYMGEDE